jgi:hypothetical protein
MNKSQNTTTPVTPPKKNYCRGRGHPKFGKNENIEKTKKGQQQQFPKGKWVPIEIDRFPGWWFQPP